MFFMFTVLVYTICFFGISNTARIANNRNLTEHFKENVELFEPELDIEEDASHKEDDFLTQNPFHLENLTSAHSNNLKSNVFDKMLSDEMLSMKQRLFEKDLAYSLTDLKMTKNNVAKPTLEVKQNWPAVDLFTRPPNTEELYIDEGMQTENSNIKIKSDLSIPESKIKSLDVRSLSGHSNFMHNSDIKCNCANTNANHQCKHGDECTRKAPIGPAVGISPYPALYMPYQPVYPAAFISDHELKIPKPTRRRRPITPRDDDLYYEDDWKVKKQSKDEIIMNIDYDIEESKNTGSAMNCIHEELKEVFNKGIQRKCYCSSFQTTRSHRNVVLICVFLCLNRYFRIHFY